MTPIEMNTAQQIYYSFGGTGIGVAFGTGVPAAQKKAPRFRQPKLFRQYNKRYGN